MKTVPWYGLTPAEFERRKTELVPQIIEHFRQLQQEKGDEACNDYFKFLTKHCQYNLGREEIFSGMVANAK